MTRSQPGEPEPPHRRWLHAVEDDLTVPGTAIQVARIFSDYAASRVGQDNASVSYPALQRQTHRSRDTIDEALTYLTAHGWLTSRPHSNGQRVVYDLTVGRPGQHRKPVRSSERSNQSGSRNGSSEGDQSGSRTATSPVGKPLPVRLPDCERLTSDNVSLSVPGTLHAALAAVVPDVTERETMTVLETLRARGARSAGAVLRAEIRDGTAPGLVADVRGMTPASARAAPDPRPSAVPYVDLYQDRECEHRDPRGPSKCALCRHARATPAA